MKKPLSINVDYINGYLCAIGELNTRTNEGYTFYIDQLDHKKDLIKTLASYYESMSSIKKEGLHTVSWEITPKQIGTEKFISIIEHWFFKQGGLSTIHEELRIENFIEKLYPIVPNCCYLYQIFVHPPHHNFMKSSGMIY